MRPAVQDQNKQKILNETFKTRSNTSFISAKCSLRCVVEVRAAGGPPLLHQVLRERVRQQLRRVQQDHWH